MAIKLSNRTREIYAPNDSYRYEVWALGYDETKDVIDIEDLLAEFDNRDEAIGFALQFKYIDDVYTEDELKYVNATCIEIRVETIREGDLSNTNIETVYSKLIYYKN